MSSIKSVCYSPIGAYPCHLISSLRTMSGMQTLSFINFQSLFLHFFFQRIDNQPVDPFPNIRRKSYRFKIALFIPIPKIVSFYFLMQDKRGVREDVLTETFQVNWIGDSMQAEDNKTEMAKNDFFGAFLGPFFGLSD